MAFPLQFLLETLVNATLMPKAKKKHSKKDEASDDILDLAHASVKKFRKVTREINKLSTGQKLLGGLALAAAGLAYLAAQEDLTAPEPKPARVAPPEAATEDALAPAPAAPRKRPKRAKFAAED
jgi:hypothetical protein